MAINVVDANVFVRQFTFSTANDIELFVEGLRNNFRRIRLAVITGKFKTVAHGSHSLTTYSNAIDRRTGQVINLSSGTNSYGRTVSGIQSDSTVSTVNRNGRAICTIHGERAVFTALVTNSNSIAQTYGDFAISGIRRSRDVAITGNI